LADGTWQKVLSEFGDLPSPPMFIVTSRLADERLWSEALNLGAYDVLAKPLHTKEVLHGVGLAGHLWKRQWERAQPPAQPA